MADTLSPRRALLRSLVAGGLVTAAARPGAAAAAVLQPGLIRAGALKAGDMIGTRDGSVLRVHAVKRVGRRVHIFVADAGQGDPTSLSPDGRGFPRARPLLVYARGVPARALVVKPVSSAVGTVDGGVP